MRLTPHRIGLFVASALTIGTACSLPAQAKAALATASVPAARTSPEETIFLEYVSKSASLEHLLRWVPGITDAQRDVIEGMEGHAREAIARLAEPLREVRRNVRRGWPSEPEFAERSINAIIVLQDSLHAQLRELLTPAQHVQFDRNLLWNEAREFDSLRRDIVAWYIYIKPFTGPSVVGASIP